MNRPRGTYSEHHLELVHRQMQLWMTNIDDGATDDWLPEGELTAPRGARIPTPGLRAVIDGWHRSFKDLDIDLRTLVVSEDGAWMTIEWVWHVTRRSDGASSSTDDAIVVELRDGKVLSWREYFDTFGWVEIDDADGELESSAAPPSAD